MGLPEEIMAGAPRERGGGRVDQPYVRVESVSKVFTTFSGEPITAVRNISFDIRPGEFTTIVGPSGCGKSTLLRIIAGLLRPTEGKVSVGGNPVEGPVRGIGFVFQRPVLFDWYKVLSNVLAPVELAGLKKRDYLARAHDLIRLVKLDGFEDKYPKELSGGMQQRVSIARALILDPEILIMDEPFGALDALTRDQLNLELLKIWRERRKTILFVTHNIPEAVLLGDRVVVFSERPGRIKSIIPVDLARPRDIEAKKDRRFGELEVELYNFIAGSDGSEATLSEREKRS
jgi:NitT/TauT family transport system ATP-binding protein